MYQGIALQVQTVRDTHVSKNGKVRAMQKSSNILVFDWKLNIPILLIELIPNITFLFEFDQVFEEKLSKYEEH
jgi:hypothetical protein